MRHGAGDNYPRVEKMNKVLIYLLLAAITVFPVRAGAQAGGEDDLFQKATSYFFQKKFDLAESLLQQIIDKIPRMPLPIHTWAIFF